MLLHSEEARTEAALYLKTNLQGIAMSTGMTTFPNEQLPFGRCHTLWMTPHHDGDEHGFGNHFEAMTCEDLAKSPIILIFLLFTNTKIHAKIHEHKDSRTCKPKRGSKTKENRRFLRTGAASRAGAT